MLLQDLLKKENNNIDIFRVIAAILVIYGHSYAFFPSVTYNDVIQRLLTFDSSSSIAVKAFFFLSGLLVTNSLLTKKNSVDFIMARFFRIFPALFVVLFITAFIIGPILTTVSIKDYFSSLIPFYYVVNSFFMDIQYLLPGVFESNARNVINGSLWTIPFEVFCYIFLISLFFIGVTKSRVLMTLVFFVVVLDQVMGNSLLFTWLPPRNEVTMLAPSFAFGAVLAVWRDKIKINLKTTAGAVLFSLLLFRSQHNYYFVEMAIFISILYISANVFVLKFRPKMDLSYGIYLWGWLVQQILASIFPDQTIVFHQIAAIIVCIVIAHFSWKYIEKPSISFGHRLINTIGYGKKAELVKN